MLQPAAHNCAGVCCQKLQQTLVVTVAATGRKGSRKAEKISMGNSNTRPGLLAFGRLAFREHFDLVLGCQKRNATVWHLVAGKT